MRIEADGTYTLPLPDRLGRRPQIGEDFAFAERRHIGAEAAALWLGVQQFMDEVFDVLEKGQLRREEALPADARKMMRLQRDRLVPPDPGRRRRPGATTGRADGRLKRRRPPVQAGRNGS